MQKERFDPIEDVKQFHETFGHPVAIRPVLIPKERLLNRIDWIISELEELKKAHEEGDIVEVADALADAQYFLSGTVIEFGLGDLFPKVFTEVQRSNMSKACNSHEEAYDTMVSYQKQNVITHINDSLGNGLYTVVRASDGKTLKSINWSEPNLEFVKDI